MRKLRTSHFPTCLSLLLLALLGIFMLVWVFTQAGSYGQTMDEPLRDTYGRSILKWYKSLGKDMSFITAYPAFEYEPQHGAIFDLITVVAERIFKHQWYTHAVIIGLSGVAGIVAIALCGYELLGPWGALLAALGLWLYPRYSGAIFNNPKDIPFAVAMTWVLWSVLLLIKKWDSKKYFWYCVLVGFCIGFAVSIRVTAVIWYGILGLMLVGSWKLYWLRIKYQKLVMMAFRKHIVACIGIGLVSLLTMVTLWPYVALSPIAHLYESITVMSKYPWNGTVLFNGVTYPAAHIPRWYAPVWLGIGSPPALVLCMLLGVTAAGIFLFRKRVMDPRLMIVLLAFFVPLASIVVLHSVLYGALRQFLFLVPPMILLAVYGITQAFRFLIARSQKIIAGGLALLLLLSYVFVIKDMVSLYPYEYVYFSPIVGGLPGAATKYETDYWGACQKASAEWLAQNYQHYTGKKHPSVEGVPNFESLVTMYLPGNFHVDEKQPDFYVDPIAISGTGNYASYRIIHTESREDVPLCLLRSPLG